MSTAGRCAGCGGTLMPGTAIQGLCAACLLGDGVDAQAHATDAGTSYRLLNILGDSERATTYLATLDGPTREHVVVKVLRSNIDPHTLAARIKRLRAELATLDHPHIVGLRDGGWPGRGRPYVISEYVRGRPLVQFCRRSEIGASERLRLLVQVCLAVAHAHESGVTHGGLGSANTLVVEQAEGTVVRVVDFGLTRLLLTSAPLDLATTVMEDVHQLVTLLQDLLSPFTSEELGHAVARLLSIDDAGQRTLVSRWTSAAQMAKDLRASFT